MTPSRSVQVTLLFCVVAALGLKARSPGQHMTTEPQQCGPISAPTPAPWRAGRRVSLLGSLAAHGIGFFYMLDDHRTLVAARSIGLVALGTTVVGFASFSPFRPRHGDHPFRRAGRRGRRRARSAWQLSGRARCRALHEPDPDRGDLVPGAPYRRGLLPQAGVHRDPQDRQPLASGPRPRQDDDGCSAGVRRDGISGLARDSAPGQPVRSRAPSPSPRPRSASAGVGSGHLRMDHLADRAQLLRSRSPEGLRSRKGCMAVGSLT